MRTRAAYWVERDAYSAREIRRFNGALDACLSAAKTAEQTQRNARAGGTPGKPGFTPMDLIDRGRVLRDGVDAFGNAQKLLDPATRAEGAGNLGVSASNMVRENQAERVFNPGGASNQKIDQLTSGARELNSQVNSARGVSPLATEIADTSLAAAGASAKDSIAKLDKALDSFDQASNNRASVPADALPAYQSGQSTVAPLRRPLAPTETGAGVTSAVAEQARLESEATLRADLQRGEEMAAAAISAQKQREQDRREEGMRQAAAQMRAEREAREKAAVELATCQEAISAHERRVAREAATPAGNGTIGELRRVMEVTSWRMQVIRSACASSPEHQAQLDALQASFAGAKRSCDQIAGGNCWAPQAAAAPAAPTYAPAAPTATYSAPSSGSSSYSSSSSSEERRERNAAARRANEASSARLNKAIEDYGNSMRALQQQRIEQQRARSSGGSDKCGGGTYGTCR